MQTNGLLMVDFVGAVHAQLEGARGSFNPLVQLALKINERLHRTGEREQKTTVEETIYRSSCIA